MTINKSEKHQEFEEQVLAHADSLFRLGFRLTGNTTDANDLLQETYLKAYRFWDQYEQGTNVRAWLCLILKNSFINQYRKRAKMPDRMGYSDLMKPEPAEQVPGEADTFHELLFENLLNDEVSGAMSCLRDDYRNVVILRDIEGFTYSEIAGFVGIPVGTVRSRLHRGRILLHSTLHEYAARHGYLESVPNSKERKSTYLRKLTREERVHADY